MLKFLIFINLNHSYRPQFCQTAMKAAAATYSTELAKPEQRYLPKCSDTCTGICQLCIVPQCLLSRNSNWSCFTCKVATPNRVLNVWLNLCIKFQQRETQERTELCTIANINVLFCNGLILVCIPDENMGSWNQDKM